MFATVTGDPVPSFPPWPAPQAKGSGVVIPCSYALKVLDANSTINNISDTLSTMSEGGAMTINITKAMCELSYNVV